MRRVLIAAMCVGLTGCADRHYAVNDSRMSITDIVNHVQCEVKRAWAPYEQTIKGENWFAAVSLSLQETVVNGANPVVGSNLAFKEGVPRARVMGGLGFSKASQETSALRMSFVMRSRR
jgi:type IV pilus biogenesis protein CpaD/CtpE